MYFNICLMKIEEKMLSMANRDVNRMTNINKMLCEHILGRRCIRNIGMHISWKSACTPVQGLMMESNEYWDSLVCR